MYKCKNCLLEYESSNFNTRKYKGNILPRLNKCKYCKLFDKDFKKIKEHKKPIQKIISNNIIKKMINYKPKLNDVKLKIDDVNNKIDGVKVDEPDIIDTEKNKDDDVKVQVEDVKYKIADVPNNIDDVKYEIIDEDKGMEEMIDTHIGLEMEELKKFNPKQLVKDKNFSIILNAKSKSGKSTFIKHVYNDYLKPNYDLVFLFTDNEVNSLYDFLEETNIYNNHHYEIIKTLFYIQKETKNKYRILIIFDDYVAKPNLKNCKMIINLFTRGRNSNFTTIYSTQYINLINKACRMNTNYSFILNATQPSNNHVLFKDYLEQYSTVFNSKNYNDKLIQFTNDYNILISDYMNNKLYTYKV